MTPREQWRSLSHYQKILLVLFLVTLPLANPWVRGDGVGYYAYVRSLLIDGDLHFENEYRAGNPTFVASRFDNDGKLHPDQITATGHVDNHFTVGPSILWAPFLVSVHLFLLSLNVLGANFLTDGYSPPYVVTMAVATALYGFLGLCLAFRLAKDYFPERSAFLATLGIWFASSLPVYMYFNPSWSHSHSAFVVALFLWYWQRTRNSRTPAQWALLGLLSGLMVNVYYPNAVMLLLPLSESLLGYWRSWRKQPRTWSALGWLFAANLVYAGALFVAFLPTLLTRRIIYGSILESGYYGLEEWSLTAPYLWDVLFSSNHGLFSWTPILLLAVAGLFVLRQQDRELAAALILCFLGFCYLIGSYASWHGISSFGNRFFVSLTPLFVLGLTASFCQLEKGWPRNPAGFAAASTATALLIVWNVGFLFQWGTHMIPPRGPISWRTMAYNQVAVVPGRFFQTVSSYLAQRRELMNSIEQQDAKKLAAPEEDR